ncbi:MAG: flagellar biosynthetic protein FliP [Phycisphaeraceae bacterium]|nr:MAG: flagellar biosynthetic protein FliP [Phycisphaeraceae bacterium]
MYGPPTSAQGLVEIQTPVNQSAAAAEDFLNPASMLSDAAEAIPGFEGGLAGALNIMVLLTVLALAPAILVMTTCFVRIIVVLGLLKQAMGTQQLPPSQVVLGLSLIMTFMVMAPTFDRVRQEALIPYQQGEINNQIEMWERAKQPMRDFMFDQIEASGNWSSVYLMLNYQGIDTSDPGELTRSDVDTMSLTCAFMLSELKIAFLMGFKIYLPFLIIDMVIASILISMSMMMLPPVLISLPFKVLLFILVDGWTLIVGSLLTSFAQPDSAERLSSIAAGGG